MKLQRSLFIVSLMVLSGISSAFSADYSWIGSGANWSIASDWRVSGTVPTVAPPTSTDNIVGTSGGGMALNSSGTVVNFTDNGGSTWNVSDAIDSAPETLTITGTLSTTLTSGRLSFFSGTTTGADGLSLVINTISDSGTAANLEFGTAGGAFRGLKSLTVTGTTTINASGKTVFIAADTASFGDVILTAGAINNTTDNATFGVVSQSAATFAIFNTVGGSGHVSVAGLTGTGGVLRVANGAPASTTTGQLTINVANSGTYSYGGLLQDSASAGQAHLSVVKTGLGTQILTGTNTYSGGTVVNQGTLGITGTGALGTGSLTVSGGVADLGGSSITNTLGALTGGGAINNGTITNNAGTYSVQSGSVGANLAGSNGLTKSTSGTVTLSGSNAYSGATAVNAGTLLINGSAGGSAFTVGSSATLGGSGTVGALSVQSGGILAPGNSPGIIHSGNLALAGSMSMQLGKAVSGSQPVAGTDYDQVSVTGTVDLTGGDLTLSLLTGIETGDYYFLVLNDAADAVTGTFATLNGVVTNLAQGQLFTVGGDQFEISYIASGFGGSPSLTGGNDVALFAVATAPEPATWALLGLSAGTLLIFRRRRALRGFAAELP